MLHHIGDRNCSNSIYCISSLLLARHVVRSLSATVQHAHFHISTNPIRDAAPVQDQRNDTNNNNNNNAGSITKQAKHHRFKRGFWKDQANHRIFLDGVARELQIKHLDDWYSVSSKQIRSRGGSTMLNLYYGNSLQRALQAVYPEHPWQVSRFSKVPTGFWDDPRNHREFFDRLGASLGVRELDDWYRVTGQEFHERGGSVMLRKYYENCLPRAMRAVYPEHPWRLSQFRFVPNLFWKKVENQRELFDEIGNQLGVKQLDDWYKVTARAVIQSGGGAVLYYYNNSLARALRAIYPEHPWERARFSKVPNGFWRDVANQRALFDRIAQELGVKHLDDWYSVSLDDVASRGAAGLLSGTYNNSLARALEAIYPEHDWLHARFGKTPRGFWNNRENHQRFFDHLAQQLNVREPEDWYRVSLEEVYAHGGSTLMHMYGSSLPKALQAVYPEYPWQPWRFARTPSNALADERVLRYYIEALAKDLEVRHLDDWYRVSIHQIYRFRGYQFINKNGGLPLVLMRIYPEHQWDPTRFSTRGKKSSQRAVTVSLKKLLPGTEIVEDYLHPEMTYADSMQPMELDVYIPSLSLGFEYHGAQHYKDYYHFGSHSNYATNDIEKVAAAKRAGVTLILVPYWCDCSPQNLAEMILSVRPDLSEYFDASAASGASSPPPPPPPPLTEATNAHTTATTATARRSVR